MKKLILAVFVSLSLVFAMATPAYAQSTTAAKQKACEGISGKAGGGCATTGGADLSRILKAIINVLSVFAGAIAVIMIIISGFRYITSAGDANAISGAKKTLIYAVVGLVVVAMAQLIVKFVLTKT